MMQVQFTVMGQPVAKGRPRFRIVEPKGKPAFVSTYTPSDTVKYEEKVALLAKRAMGLQAPTDRGVEMRIELHMQIPVSWSKKKQAAALAGLVLATKKPDSGNVQKAIEDAMNGIVYVDDSQIVTHTVWKKYSDNPRIVVAVRDLPGEPA